MTRLNKFAILVSGLAMQTVTAQRFVNRTTSSAPAASSAPQSIFTTSQGPYMNAYSYTWSQYITPTTVGTVHVTVNEATNETFSTTIFHTEFEANGTRGLLTRTDTDSAGTVTDVVTGIFKQDLTVTYPTNIFDATNSMTWYAMFPTTLSTGNGASCCIRSSTRSHTPTHSPFPQTGIVDPIDPQGWLYKLTGVEFGDPFEVLNPSEISSLWAPTSLGISYAGCFHTACNVTSSTVAAAQAVHSQANILATTTTTISSVGKTTSQAAAKQSATALPAAKPAPTTPLNPTPTPTKSPEPAPTSPAPKPDPQPSSPAPKDNPPPPASSPKVDSVPTTANTDKPPQNAGGSTSARGSTSTETPPAQPVIIIGSISITQNSASAFVISSQTLALNSPITLGSGSSTTVIAIRTSDSATIIQIGTASSTIIPNRPAPTTPSPPSPTPIVIDNSITLIPDSSSNYVYSGQTLAPGSPVTLGSGTSATVIAIRTSNSATILQVGTRLSTLIAPTPAPPSATPIVVGSITLTPDSSSHYIYSSQTLAPGSPITVGSGSSATVIALHTSGSYTILAVGTSSSTISRPTNAAAVTSAAPFTVIGGQTLRPGEGIVVSGTTITDLNGYILYGLGGGSLPAVSTATTATATTASEDSAGGTSSSSVSPSSSSSTSSSTQSASDAISNVKMVQWQMTFVLAILVPILGLIF